MAPPVNLSASSTSIRLSEFRIRAFMMHVDLHFGLLELKINKMLSYRRETALQGTLVLAESGRLELRDNILLIL